MRKLSLFILGFLLIALLGIGFLWISKTTLFARLLSREFHTHVSIGQMGYSSGRWLIDSLHIANPPASKRPTAFFAETIEIDISLKNVLRERLTFDLIEMDNITLEIELYSKDGSKNNWALLLAEDSKKKNKVAKSNSKPVSEKQKTKYLIKKIKLSNITVLLTDEKGNTKTLGTIPYLEFDNISDESGIPADEIEKIIFNMILKSIFQQFGLEVLKKLADPSFVVPHVWPLFSN